MLSKPLVSVVIIFLNADEFLEDAIQSVLSQSYEHWELFLVDDGSVDESTQIARHYVTNHPGKVVYLEHPDHRNLGKGISRNLGLRRAQGEYVAFLDADDIWLPNKLEEQVAILRSYPEVGMLYGDTLYWHSWTGNPDDNLKDFIPKLGVKTNTPLTYPSLMPLYLRGKAAVPCTCSIIASRKVVENVAGFDETCPGIANFYEDQAFYAKICFETPVVAVNTCWDKYRQRPNIGNESGKNMLNAEHMARKSFLNWLDEYMTQRGINETNIRLAIQKELWLQENLAWLTGLDGLQARLRWLKKWILRLEELVLPVSIQYRLWIKD
jgi:glycosyltransferase involved in cell wall biosynthesis